MIPRATAVWLEKDPPCPGEKVLYPEKPEDPMGEKPRGDVTSDSQESISAWRELSGCRGPPVYREK